MNTLTEVASWIQMTGLWTLDLNVLFFCCNYYHIH